ncbi:MAG: PHP domain-containing protein, partial [Candidatus Margulisbacteria bacterium]|nr:PHP domain-containing protein [Candidatus Margulisiibacteriota bacterium]
MPADLHVHTKLSDGLESPEELVLLAKEGGLNIVAITDHDVIAAIARAQEKGRELGLEVIPGIEFTTEDYGAELHILGYFIDYHNPQLLDSIKKMQKGREDRIFKICEKLKGLGFELDPDKIFGQAEHRAPGRPHIARAMVEAGYVNNFREAFRGCLEFGGPAYVPHYKLTAIEAIKLISEASGLAVFAHPAVSGCDQVIPDLMSAGLAGLEVYYPSHNEGQTEHYLNLAKKYNLLATGGSDYHGLDSGRNLKLGDFTIPDELVEKLKNEH